MDEEKTLVYYLQRFSLPRFLDKSRVNTNEFLGEKIGGYLLKVAVNFKLLGL
jgi:hypothetical protein